MPRHRQNRSPQQQAPAHSAVERRWSRGLVGLLLIWLAIGIAYLPALNGGMLLDDNDHITKPELRSF
ncbi:MAG: hypothetical protein IT427_16510, partial [Pirellulales bacterium]|nr:hypothetical protein [Pirellulales bacterium]